MAVFFTSDTHFGAFRTLELSRRPFGSVEEMDRCMLDNINAVVSEGDILYHIGDFGDYEKVKEINCDVILVMGNYDLACRVPGAQMALPLLRRPLLISNSDERKRETV